MVILFTQTKFFPIQISRAFTSLSCLIQACVHSEKEGFSHIWPTNSKIETILRRSMSNVALGSILGARKSHL